jgi:hypothetical protein
MPSLFASLFTMGLRIVKLMGAGIPSALVVLRSKVVDYMSAGMPFFFFNFFLAYFF